MNRNIVAYQGGGPQTEVYKMVNLNKVEGASQFHRVDKKSSQRGAKKGEATHDRVEISAEGRALLRTQHTVDLVKARLRELPDVRQERIRQVNERIQEGYYNRDEVQKAAVEGILETCGLR
jgi:anti-sigma28 factor (negative regulator of flagellin synthesis)